MKPLAERLRPSTLDEYIGQKHLVGNGAVLRRMIDSGHISSFILSTPLLREHPNIGQLQAPVSLVQALQCLFRVVATLVSP